MSLTNIEMNWVDEPPEAGKPAKGDPRYQILKQNPGRWVLWAENVRSVSHHKGFQKVARNARKDASGKTCFDVYCRYVGEGA